MDCGRSDRYPWFFYDIVYVLYLVGLDLIWVGVGVGCIFFGLVKSYYMIMVESADIYSMPMSRVLKLMVDRNA